MLWPASSRSSALADLVSIGTLFAFIVVSIAVPVLRRTQPGHEAAVPDAARPPCCPIVSALACLYLMTNLAWRRGCGSWSGWRVGLVVYLTYGRRNARLAQSDYDRTASSTAR